MSDALEGQTADISTLLSTGLEKWNQHVNSANQSLSNSARIIERNRTHIALLTSYADALDELVKPFSFSKAPSDQFLDQGGLGLGAYTYVPMWRDYHDPRMAAGGKEFNIGTVDYWAAALVDKDFAASCRERLAWRNAFYSGSGNSAKNLANFDAHDVHGVKQSTSPSDGVPKFRFLDYFTMDTGGNPAQWIGARNRIDKKLARRFEALLADPEQGPLIKKLREFFVETAKDLAARYDRAGKENGRQAEATRDVKAQFCGDAEKLFRLAYLQEAGYHKMEGLPLHEILFDGKRADGKIGVPLMIGYDRYDGVNRPVAEAIKKNLTKQGSMIPFNPSSLAPEDQRMWSSNIKLPTPERAQAHFMKKADAILHHDRA